MTNILFSESGCISACVVGGGAPGTAGVWTLAFSESTRRDTRERQSLYSERSEAPGFCWKSSEKHREPRKITQPRSIGRLRSIEKPVAVTGDWCYRFWTVFALSEGLTKGGRHVCCPLSQGGRWDTVSTLYTTHTTITLTLNCNFIRPFCLQVTKRIFFQMLLNRLLLCSNSNTHQLGMMFVKCSVVSGPQKSTDRITDIDWELKMLKQMLICYKSKKNNKQCAYNNAKYTALQHCAKQNHVKITVCLFICCHRK